MRIPIALALAAATLPAQVEQRSPADATETRTVRELFAATDPASKAWAAELSARYDRKDAIPEILRLLDWDDERVRGFLVVLTRLSTLNVLAAGDDLNLKPNVELRAVDLRKTTEPPLPIVDAKARSPIK